MLPLLKCKQSKVINPPPGSWLITMGTGVIWRTQCSSLLLEDWALSSGCSQVGLLEWKSMLLSLCTTSILAIMASFFISLLVNGISGWKKKRLSSIPSMGHTVYLCIKSYLCWGHLLVSIFMGHLCLPSVHIWKVLSTYIFPDHLVANIPTIFPPSLWLSSHTTGHSSWNRTESNVWTSFFPCKMVMGIWVFSLFLDGKDDQNFCGVNMT